MAFKQARRNGDLPECDTDREHVTEFANAHFVPVARWAIKRRTEKFDGE
jgi:hypothetical protein